MLDQKVEIFKTENTTLNICCLKNNDRNFQNIFKQGFVNSKNCRIFAPAIENKDLGKNLVQWPIRLSVRTSDFHSGKRGSIPLWATKKL